MYEIDNVERCFGFLKSLYEDEVVPKFDEVEILGIDEDLLDEKGNEETILMGDSKQLNYGKYYAIVRNAKYNQYTIPFDYERVILKNNDEVLYKNNVPSLRQQMLSNSIKESDLIFIILDERCENKRKSSRVLRSITIFCAEGFEESLGYDAALGDIESQLNHYEKQIIELDNLKMAFEHCNN